MTTYTGIFSTIRTCIASRRKHGNQTTGQEVEEWSGGQKVTLREETGRDVVEPVPANHLTPSERRDRFDPLIFYP
ncbi:MAG: hypothetical protein WC934_02145 [Acidithiobacillus sp.]|jgi:hypothetical protein|uniref:hypothetical protein n=1 Tax=Acidithiobacillus sp. TaxID=1872118 RepID=UPI00355D07D1